MRTCHFTVIHMWHICDIWHICEVVSSLWHWNIWHVTDVTDGPGLKSVTRHRCHRCHRWVASFESCDISQMSHWNLWYFCFVLAKDVRISTFKYPIVANVKYVTCHTPNADMSLYCDTSVTYVTSVRLSHKWHVICDIEIFDMSNRGVRLCS